MNKLIIGNWKSNKNVTELGSWVEHLNKNLIPQLSATVAIAPPYPLLQPLAKMLEESRQSVQLAVQDISAFPAGAYTGEVSAVNLIDLDVRFAIIGHSERRKYLAETDSLVANKVDQALQNKIMPVVCVDDDYIATQANAIAADQRAKCVVAYENIAAIGSDTPTPVEELQPVFEKIKAAFGEQVVMLYGGSVKPGNAGKYLAACNGVLVGGASLEAAQFADIIMAAAGSE